MNHRDRKESTGRVEAGCGRHARRGQPPAEDSMAAAGGSAMGGSGRSRGRRGGEARIPGRPGARRRNRPVTSSIPS